MTGIFIMSVSAQAFSTPLYRPVVVVFGDSSQVETTVNTLVADYPQSTIINYQDTHSLFSVLTLMRSYSALILVGHGSDQGILGPNNAIISWHDIGAWVNTLPSTYVFFLACDSNGATKFVNTHSFGFSGTIDGVLGATGIAADLQRANGNAKVAQQLMTQFMARIFLLQSGKVNPVNLLIVCDSPMSTTSTMSANTITPACGGGGSPPPTYTITFTESGLPSGTTWSIVFNGVTHSSSSSSISIGGLSSGAYSYSTENVQGNDLTSGEFIYSIYYPTISGANIVLSSSVTIALSFIGPYIKNMHYLSIDEAMYDTAMLAMDIVLTLLPAGDVDSTLKDVIHDAIWPAKDVLLPMAVGALNILITGGSLVDLANVIVGSISTILSIVISAIEAYPWSLGELLIIDTIILSTLLFWEATGDVALAVQLAIALAVTTIDLQRLVTDYNDIDTTPAY